MAVGPLTATIAATENPIYQGAGGPAGPGTSFMLSIANAGSTATNLQSYQVLVTPTSASYSVSATGSATGPSSTIAITASGTIYVPFSVTFNSPMYPGRPALPNGVFGVTVNGVCSDGTVFSTNTLQVLPASPFMPPQTPSSAGQAGALNFEMDGAPGQLQFSNAALYFFFA